MSCYYQPVYKNLQIAATFAKKQYGKETGRQFDSNDRTCVT